MSKKPKHLLVFKMIGFIALVVAIVGIVLTMKNFGNVQNMNPSDFMLGGTLTCVGLFVGMICLTIGFKPEFTKMGTKTTKYIQEENKEDLADIASTKADISSEAITKVAQSVKKGLKDTKYCKYCGAEIDADSKFCSACGKEQ